MVKMFNSSLIGFFAFLVTSCNEYQKILNNEDLNLKYKALRVITRMEIRRANRIFEQLVPSYRGKPQAERLMYFFADTYYQTKNYYLAAYQLKILLNPFPNHKKLLKRIFTLLNTLYDVSRL